MDIRDFTQALDRLEAATGGFAALADAVGDGAAPVPTCPGWSVTDLVIHLGGIHAWAASTIGAEHPPSDPPFSGAGRPLGEWYREQAAVLLGVLREAGPEAAAWTLWGDRVAAFWARRQLHETLVHSFDLAAATRPGDADVWSIGQDTAVDGLREVLAGFYPRQLRLGRTEGLPGVVRFEVLDDDGERLESLETPALNGPEPLGTVRGTARELYLAIWGRAPFPAGTAPELTEAIRRAKLVP